MSYWDKWKHDDQADPYVKFTDPGQSVEGVVTRLSSTDFGGTSEPIPVVHLRTAQGAEKIVNCSQRVLQRRMAELSPEVGDGVKITYTGEAQRSMPGRNPAKLFDVEVTPASLVGARQENVQPQRPLRSAPAQPDDDLPF